MSAPYASKIPKVPYRRLPSLPLLSATALLRSSLLLLSLMGTTATGAAAASGGSTCPQWVNDEIQQCVQPVAEFAKTLNSQQGDEGSAAAKSPMPAAEFGQALQWPTKIGGQVFRDLCRLISDFELCVETHRDKCKRHITISLIEASYGFLCNEGYDTFMASAECLMELDQRPSVKQCHDRTLRDIEEANNDQSGVIATKLDKMCNALNFFSDCVHTPIRQSCGVDAWRVIFRVLKDTTRTLMPMCEFDDGEEEEETQQRDSPARKEPAQSEEAKQRREQQTANSAKVPPVFSSSEERREPPAKQPMNANNNEGWEEWEEDEAEKASREEADGHQIHYELRQNGAWRAAGRWHWAICAALLQTIISLLRFSALSNPFYV